MALQLALKLLDLKKNDEVIIPDLTFVADANAVLACNAKPVVTDINKENFFLSISKFNHEVLLSPSHAQGSVAPDAKFQKFKI